MIKQKYPDGTGYVTLVEESKDIIFKINSYEDLHYLELYVDAYTYRYKERPSITIPNLLDAQADRRFAPNQSSGLKIICKRLNNIEADFTIFHPHNAEVVEASVDNVKILDNRLFIEKVLQDLGNNVYTEDAISKLEDNLILMASDAGGFKPLMKLCDTLKWKGETFSAAKYRSYTPSQGTYLAQQLGREDFYGQDILIIDDISVYGGTFKGLSKLLREKNCGKLYLAVSHMTVQDLGRDPVTNYFDKVFTTNSKFDKYFHYTDYEICLEEKDYREPENLEILNLF